MEMILYVGGFQLPDENAAAQRVIGIAKGLRALGHRVVFLNLLPAAEKEEWKEYFGFPCYEVQRPKLAKWLTDIREVIRIAEEIQATGIVAYNYPAVCLMKLLKYCKMRGIRCFADATEWYVPKGNPVYRMIKTIDSEWRMRILHKKTDGVIAISEYLYQYYKAFTKTVKIPPTVDMAEEKWHRWGKEDDGITRFVYAGSPSAQKERLDLIVEAVRKAGKISPVQLKIVGITAQQYEALYGTCCDDSEIIFCGRVSHRDAVRCVAEADWSIVIRDNHKVVKAGFPTKVVESIACGTPVLANRFSNLEDYLDEENSILCEFEALEAAVGLACREKRKVASEIFDYHSYLEELGSLLCLEK